VFFDWKSIFCHEFVPCGQMVNRQEVSACLRDAVCRKRPEFWENPTWLLHHDNAPAHTSLLIRSYLAKHQTSVVARPPYSLFRLVSSRLVSSCVVSSLISCLYSCLVSCLVSSLVSSLDVSSLVSFLVSSCLVSCLVLSLLVSCRLVSFLVWSRLLSRVVSSLVSSCPIPSRLFSSCLV